MCRCVGFRVNCHATRSKAALGDGADVSKHTAQPKPRARECAVTDDVYARVRVAVARVERWKHRLSDG